MCKRHDVETDDVIEYTAERLREIKAQHEANHGRKQFKIDESIIYKIETDMRKYWINLEHTQQTEHIIPELAVRLDTQNSSVELFNTFRAQISRLQEFVNGLSMADHNLDDEIRGFLMKCGYRITKYKSVPYYNNPFINRSWETHNLGIPNSFLDIEVQILIIEIRFLQEYLKTNSNDEYSPTEIFTSKRGPAFASMQCWLQQLKFTLMEQAIQLSKKY